MIAIASHHGSDHLVLLFRPTPFSAVSRPLAESITNHAWLAIKKVMILLFSVWLQVQC